jgi:hypothetical protein
MESSGSRHGHVGLWPRPLDEAGQDVAVKVNESEGSGGVALADVVDKIEGEVTVRAHLTSLTRVSNHKSLPRADSPNALTSITRSSLSTSAGAYPRLVRQAQLDYQPTADRAQRNPGHHIVRAFASKFRAISRAITHGQGGVIKVTRGRSLELTPVPQKHKRPGHRPVTCGFVVARGGVEPPTFRFSVGERTDS